MTRSLKTGADYAERGPPSQQLGRCPEGQGPNRHESFLLYAWCWQFQAQRDQGSRQKWPQRPDPLWQINAEPEARGSDWAVTGL